MHLLKPAGVFITSIILSDYAIRPDNYTTLEEIGACTVLGLMLLALWKTRR